jgi:rod shape-determining protein MreC
VSHFVSRQPARRRSARRGALILAAALGLGLLAPAARFFGATAWPLFAVERAASAALAPLGDYLSDKRALADENRELREAVERLHVAALERDGLRAERDQLAAELAVPGRDSRAVVAEIWLRPPQVAFDTVVLAAGTRDGIAVGDVALAAGVPVGAVVEAGAGRSIVALFSAPGARLGVTVGGLVAEAAGRGGGRYSVELPAPLAPATGTPVLSTAHGGAPVGYVAAVSPGEGESTVEAQVFLPIDLSSARYLAIDASGTAE